MTDVELLEQHRTGSDSAFTDLVRRHLGWVYAMARRRLNNSHLAEDVAQAVFILLHRKAPHFPADGAMIRWLHKTTWYATESAARTERRRRHLESQVAMMQPQITAEDSNEWEELAPMLDQLLDRLPRVDREAILLRYYRQLSFAEVGLQLSMTEDAARKRVERAVAKLRNIFSTKGVEVSASMLSANLLKSAVAHPPAGLLTTTTCAATAPAGSALISSSIPITKGALIMAASAKLTVIGISAAAVLLVSGGVWVTLSLSSPDVPKPSVAPTSQVATAASPNKWDSRLADAPWLVGNAFPKVSPFSGIRWQGTSPQVRVNGTWYDWIALDDLPVAKIVEGAQKLDTKDWQKRINEDLVELLARMDHPTGQTVRLDLRDPTTGETKTFASVAMTEANRQSLVGVNTAINKRVAPFSAIRWQGTTPQVRVNDTWYEWIALDDLPVPKIVEGSQQLYRDIWQKRINEDLVELLDQMNHPTGATVKLDLRDLTTGQTTTLTNVAMTAENRRAIMEGNKP